jgi:hypothetical protein
VVVVLVDKGKEDELHVANLVQGIKGVAVERLWPDTINILVRFSSEKKKIHL